jgi:2-keto-3-deoxy-L-rhamnonate aldolase
VRETLSYIVEAKDSGADFALVLPPAYWVAAMNASVVEGFFHDVNLVPRLTRTALSQSAN